jgi:hypothetical protein
MVYAINCFAPEDFSLTKSPFSGFQFLLNCPIAWNMAKHSTEHEKLNTKNATCKMLSKKKTWFGKVARVG